MEYVDSLMEITITRSLDSSSKFLDNHVILMLILEQYHKFENVIHYVAHGNPFAETKIYVF